MPEAGTVLNVSEFLKSGCRYEQVGRPRNSPTWNSWQETHIWKIKCRQQFVASSRMSSSKQNQLFKEEDVYSSMNSKTLLVYLNNLERWIISRTVRVNNITSWPQQISSIETILKQTKLWRIVIEWTIWNIMETYFGFKTFTLRKLEHISRVQTVVGPLSKLAVQLYICKIPRTLWDNFDK